MTQSKKPQATLNDDDVTTRRGVGRRSFILGTLGGTAALAGCVPTQTTYATGLTDRDLGAYADPAGNGRGRRFAGVTDSDIGFTADPAGGGTGRARNSCTDADLIPGDPVGRGRRC
jgi:hypothetical protein